MSKAIEEKKLTFATKKTFMKIQFILDIYVYRQK